VDGTAAEVDQLLGECDNLAHQVKTPCRGDVVFVSGEPNSAGVYMGGGKYLTAVEKAGVVMMRLPKHDVKFYRVNA
jgi:cell wall-associated NlpC family hydrolase